MNSTSRRSIFFIASLFLAAAFATASVVFYKDVRCDYRWIEMFDALTIGTLAFGIWLPLHVRFFQRSSG